jgi:hypothetical protein
MGIDPGWGSSPFGIVVTQFVDGGNQIQILYADEFARPDYNEMLSKVWELIRKYNPNKILIDGANPSFIRSLKIQLGEDPDYDKVIDRYKSRKLDWQRYMKVLPINFNQEHKTMLTHCKMLLEQGYVAIHSSHDKLITLLRTAVEDNGMLDKETTSYNDIFDAYRLALRYYKINQRGEEEQKE